jgi:hypothetical protein
MSRLAAASTTPVANAAMDENSKISFRTLAITASPNLRKIPSSQGQATPAPWPKGDRDCRKLRQHDTFENCSRFRGLGLLGKYGRVQAAMRPSRGRANRAHFATDGQLSTQERT